MKKPARIVRDGAHTMARTTRCTMLVPTPIKRFIADESGATAIEYGLIAAGISIAIITVVNNIGTSSDPMAVEPASGSEAPSFCRLLAANLVPSVEGEADSGISS